MLPRWRTRDSPVRATGVATAAEALDTGPAAAPEVEGAPTPISSRKEIDHRPSTTRWGSDEPLYLIAPPALLEVWALDPYNNPGALADATHYSVPKIYSRGKLLFKS